MTALQPGDAWQTEIDDAVRASSVFVLCWCCQSSSSALSTMKFTGLAG